jgi:hypothetical protein
MPPIIAQANELTIEVTNAENQELFAGKFFSVPSVMAHLKNYYDFSDNTYLELGLSGLWGTNNKRGYVTGPPGNEQLDDEPWRHTAVAGVDLTVHWQPLERAKYRSFTWRSEGYFAWKQTATDPDLVTRGTAEADGERIAWGAYSYLDYQLGTRWFAGVRGDLALPLERAIDELAWDVVPYLTFWQSEFVYLRLEYQHRERFPHQCLNGAMAQQGDDRVMLQIDWAAGPHKHEKY